MYAVVASSGDYSVIHTINLVRGYGIVATTGTYTVKISKVIFKIQYVEVEVSYIVVPCIVDFEVKSRGPPLNSSIVYFKGSRCANDVGAFVVYGDA